MSNFEKVIVMSCKISETVREQPYSCNDSMYLRWPIHEDIVFVKYAT